MIIILLGLLYYYGKYDKGTGNLLRDTHGVVTHWVSVFVVLLQKVLNR